jgi:hypothetical protein
MTKITIFSWENIKTAIVWLLAISAGVAVRSNSKKIDAVQGYCEGLAISLETTSELAIQITDDVLNYNLEQNQKNKEMLSQFKKDLEKKCYCRNYVRNNMHNSTDAANKRNYSSANKAKL